MAQEKGAVARLCLGREVTWGTAAIGNFLQLPIISVSGGGTAGLGMSQALQGDRNATEPFLDELSCRLSITMQPDIRSIGFVLCELFGLPVTTGAGPYTHVFKIGTSLPVGMTLEKFFAVNSIALQNLGMKFNSIAFDLSSGGVLTVRLEAVGTEEVANAVIDAAPYKYAVVPFRMKSAELRQDGVQTGKATKFSLEFMNNLEEIRTVANGSKIGNLLEGVTSVRGQVGFLFENLANRVIAEAETETAFKVKFPAITNAAHYMEFDVQEARVNLSGPSIEGPGGQNIDYDWIGFKDNGAGGSSVVVTLVNDVALYTSIPA